MNEASVSFSPDLDIKGEIFESLVTNKQFVLHLCSEMLTTKTTELCDFNVWELGSQYKSW